jgi:RHS repeat-associated protein
MKNEWYIYGSSGHGRFARAFPVGLDKGYDNLFYPSPTIQSRYLKHKQYELKDHLGNVRVVVSDFKKSIYSGDSVRPYRAEVLAAYNYYPFGMLQPGMYSENDNLRYRFGFNGMLRDDDVTDKLSTTPADEGRGNSYSTQFRQYDPRVTRWFSNDPLKMKFPWTSPYTGMGNNPVMMVDPFGLEGYMISLENDPNVISEGLDYLNQEMEGAFFSITNDKIDMAGQYVAKTELESQFIEAIGDKNTHFAILFSKDNFIKTNEGKPIALIPAVYMGAMSTKSGNIGYNAVNLDHLTKWKEVGGVSTGINLMHEGTEAYIGAKLFGEHEFERAKFEEAHNAVMRMDPSQHDGVKSIRNTNFRTNNYEFYLEGPLGKRHLFQVPISTDINKE